MFKDNLIVNQKLEKGKLIGKGQFGEVFKGKGRSLFLISIFPNVLSKHISNGFVDQFTCVSLGSYHGPNGTQEVAIKIPKIPVEIESLKAFYAEAQITLGFNHENVLSCLGISTGYFLKCILFAVISL